MDKKTIFHAALVILPIVAIIIFGLDMVITAILLVIFLSILAVTKKLETRNSILIIVLFFTFSITYMFYLAPSIILAKGQGTVLSNNWFEALNWIKDNTKECAVVATYWDPGHFITGIAERSVVFDGASQGSTIFVPSDGKGQGLVTEKYDNGAVQIKLYDDVGHQGEIRRARKTSEQYDWEKIVKRIAEMYKGLLRNSP